jgi:hypothetical protein
MNNEWALVLVSNKREFEPRTPTDLSLERLSKNGNSLLRYRLD